MVVVSLVAKCSSCDFHLRTILSQGDKERFTLMHITYSCGVAVGYEYQFNLWIVKWKAMYVTFDLQANVQDSTPVQNKIKYLKKVSNFFCGS